MDHLKNYSDTPLVTVQVAMHNGDAHLAQRSLGSLVEQLPEDQLQVVIAFDGDANEDTEHLLAQVCSELPFPVHFFGDAGGEPTGYYTVPRNRSFPMCWGFYIAHMDADNEYLPGHLEGLLKAIRIPDADSGWPHFTYSRREYVHDDDDPTERRYWYWDQGEADWRLHGFTSAHNEAYPKITPPWDSPRSAVPGQRVDGIPVRLENLPRGPSPFTPWTPENIVPMQHSPQANFIDTGDFLIGRSALYELAERSGCVWNNNVRRFGDWDLVNRLSQFGFRGQAVDQVTHRYHWTGKNLQLTRPVSDINFIPADVYEALKAEGKVRG